MTMTRLVQFLLFVASLTAVAWLALLLISSRVWASECYSLRTLEQRQACLAQERGAPEDCLGAGGPDQRIICRQRAEQTKKFREMEGRFGIR